jgi:WD40 repeat protein
MDLWEVATGKNIATFWGHTTDVQCFAFSQDGTLLVSGGHDGAIYLWDLKPYL